MAEEATAPVAVDATKPTEIPSRPAETADSAVAPDAKPANDGDVASADAPIEDQAPQTTAAAEDQVAKEESTDAQVDAAPADSDAAAATTAEASATTNGTPASKKANNRRKSNAGVPEHKGKKTPKGKKKQPELHLNTVPGDMWMVAMRGYQPWPVIVCDEDMLPETLLAKRPVSAIRVDGTYREDYLEGGKNAKDRRYPVMFLGTNEFAWQVNTDLLPFDIEDVKKDVASGSTLKKNKSLALAYEEAAQGHDLKYYKEMLSNHEQAMVEDAESKAAKAEEKAAKKGKASKRKSTAAVDSEDVEMEDADDAPATGKKKGTKRKKDDASDGEQGKPAKTPKTKLKINNKPPKDASAAKPKKESKAKKAKASEDEAEAAPEVPQMTEEERRQKREKSVLYLRHRLQKGFLSRDAAPKDEEMPNMADYLKQLEDLEELEAEIIKATKVHKVLKNIIKLNSIPRDDEFNFKTRSNALLTKWTTVSDADAPASATPTTNGVNHDEEKKAADTTSTKSPEPAASTEEAKPMDADGDVAMGEAKEEAPAAKDEAPKAEAPVEETSAA